MSPGRLCPPPGPRGAGSPWACRRCAIVPHLCGPLPPGAEGLRLRSGRDFPRLRRPPAGIGLPAAHQGRGVYVAGSLFVAGFTRAGAESPSESLRPLLIFHVWPGVSVSTAGSPRGDRAAALRRRRLFSARYHGPRDIVTPSSHAPSLGLFLFPLWPVAFSFAHVPPSPPPPGFTKVRAGITDKYG